MTGSALTMARQRPSTSLRRALGHEWHHHRDRFLLYALLAVVIAVVAAVGDVRFGWVAILLAARLPAALAQEVREDGRQLRSALGISRADAVRARTLMVCGGQLVLALGAAGAILFAQWPADERHWASFDHRPYSGVGPTPMGLIDHLVDIGLWTGALLWTHALVGGHAFRLGEHVSKLGALASFLGICVVAGVLFSASSAAAIWALGLPALEFLDAVRPERLVLAARSGQVVALLLTLSGGAFVLALALRRWVRRA